MRRSLKIVSHRKHPNLQGSEGSASSTSSKKVSPPGPESRVVGKANFDLSPSFGLSSTPKSLSSTSRLWRETRCRLEESLGPRRTRREKTPREEKKERIALETIDKLMVTIFHYLSNPLTILLGKVELLSEATENGGVSKEDVKRFTDSCKREIHKIDLIIKVFQNLCEVRYKTYPPGVKMLDVEKEIKNRLKGIQPF